MIVCGWCGNGTPDELDCLSCGHEDPAKPWHQRGMEPPDHHALQIAQATKRLRMRGERVTDETLAEELDISPRTLGRWRQKVSD